MFGFAVLLILAVGSQAFNQEAAWPAAVSLHQFHAADIHGRDIPLSNYAGNVVLVVNVASKCGLTENNYKQLVQLDEKYHDKGLRVLAFPANQFANQEPDSNEEIYRFVTEKFNVRFDMFSKIDVNGPNAHPLYKWLEHRPNLPQGDVEWNFAKFLINKDGIPVGRYDPHTEPLDIEEDIVTELES